MDPGGGLWDCSIGEFWYRRLRPTRLTARGVSPAHASSLHQLGISSALDPTRCKAQRRWGPPSQAGLEGRRVPPGEENCGLLEEYSSAFVVAQVLFSACELGVFDLLAEVLEALGSAAVAARLGVSSRGTELLLHACVSLKLLQVEVRREKAVYENTELASTYLARASPKSQQDMLLYAARTTYLGWGHLAARLSGGRNRYLKAFGVPSEELFTAIYSLFSVSTAVRILWAGLQAGLLKLREQSLLTLPSWWRKTPCEPARIRRVYWGPGGQMSLLRCDAGGDEKEGRPSLHVGHWEAPRTDAGLGGSGAVAKVCMSLYPGSQVTVFDIPDVVQMAKRHFSFPEDERIGLCEGDFFKDCLPEPDLCILARALHDWTDEKCSHLLVRICQACKTDMW
ncbi:acetylserotonin O-methyltransferase [Globicephala melas]|uniref:acetylserotonin O-methyltransferase n=1 Tax=Globicephala melas TaxID=9731 RepID=UPI003872E48E